MKSLIEKLEFLKCLPTAWILPVVMCIPTLYLIVCKGTYESTAKLTYLGTSFNWFIVFLKQIAQFAFLAVIHYWVGKKIFDRFHISHLYLNSLFYGIYFEIFGFTLYDFEYSRINMQQTLPSIFTTYVGRFGGESITFSEPIYNIPNGKVQNVARNIIYESMLDSPVFWLTTISTCLIWFALQAFYAYMYRYEIIGSTIKGKTSKSFQKNFKKEYIDPSPSKGTQRLKLYTFRVYHILALIYVFTLIDTFLIPSDKKTVKFSTSPYSECVFLAFSHFEKKLSKQTQKQLINLTRFYLPPGRRWLDNRKHIVYPAVHGDMKAFCAYNPEHEDCKDFKPPEQKPLVKKMPNVLFLIYESLTPNYYLISKDFVREHTAIGENDPKQLITDTHYYNESIMPNLNRYEKEAITFSGMSSLGIPTSSGWHGLMTGLPPSQTFLNIIDGAYMHSDDLPSQMRNYNYRNVYVSASLFSFDGSRNWVWRRPAEEEAQNRLHCKEAFGDLINDTRFHDLIGEKNFPHLRNCTKKEVSELADEISMMGLDFPKWYDYVFAYMPRKDNAKPLGLDPETVPENSTWPGDRLTAHEFITHYKQNRDYLKSIGQGDKPIFGSLLSIESHIPYFGYDMPKFYDDIIPIRKDMTADEIKEARFLRVSHYADKYQIGKVLDWVKENDPNTIFVVTGDHGTRDIPIRDADSPVYDNIVFSSDCVHHSSGIDSYYVTSGMIGYLGDDPVIKEALKLNDLAGKTIKVPTDHNDLVFTIEDILNRLNGTSMQPTHRRSRNLIDLSYNISNGLNAKSVPEIRDEIDKSGWNSFSITTFNSEYRQGTSLLRSHTANPKGSHFYEHVSYPTCLRNKTAPPMKLGTKKGREMYDTMFKHIQVETHLTYNNRLYNYAFRDNECIEEGKCYFAEPQPLVFNDDFFMGVITGIPFLVMFLFGIITEIFAFIYLEINKSRTDEVELRPHSDIPQEVQSSNDDEEEDPLGKKESLSIL